jgi:hypothetical protein
MQVFPHERARVARVKAVHEFEAAAITIVSLSWLYTFILYYNIPVVDPVWLSWAAGFIVSVYWLFTARAHMTRALHHG